MKYIQIPLTYKYDILAAALEARELEHFHYDFDRINFEKMLETLPEGQQRAELLGRLETTLIQMDSVERIYAALMSQVDDPKALEDAIARNQSKKNDA